MNAAPPHYENWNLQLPAIAPRTVLSPLTPQGLGTDASECLTSYVARLASAHQLAVGDLLRRYYLPRLREVRDAQASRCAWSLHKFVAANGADTLARDLLQFTESFTQQSGLSPTTLVDWEAVIPRLNLLRARRAWCAACYAAQIAEGGMPWDALCWMVDPVRVCPRHHQPLTEQCPQCQRSSVPVLQRYLPGWCAHCGSWLGATTTMSARLVPENEALEIWVGENVGALLAATPSLSTPPPRQQLMASMQYCCNEWLEGNTNSLARLLGVAATTARWWHAGRNLPPLRLLAQLSYWTQIPLLHFVTEPAAVQAGLRAAPPPPDFALRKASAGHLHRRNPLACEQVRVRMEAALRETPPPALTEVATRLGYRCVTTLWYKFPALCKELVARYRVAAEDPSGRQVTPKEAKVYPTDERLRELLEQELASPTPRAPDTLGRQCGYHNGFPLCRKFPALYEALLQKRQRLRAEAQAARLAQCRQALAAALAETPTPALVAVAQRVAGGSVRFLRQHCAELCDRLAACREIERVQRITEAGQQLQQALTTDPPRSLNQLARELGYHFSTLVVHYPDLCRALIERYAAHLQQQAANKEKAKVLYTAFH